jgi:hypothetical protein
MSARNDESSGRPGLASTRCTLSGAVSTAVASSCGRMPAAGMVSQSLAVLACARAVCSAWRS